ncbi:MAG: diphthine--ammonia ligase [Candidatus Aenigmatarchaeota archaeon]
MIGKRAAVLFSGGKDSTLAAYAAVKKGYRIECLVSIIPESPESWMFHYPNIELTKLQAEAMGVPIVTRRTKGRKEAELRDLELVLRKVAKKVDVVVAGAIASRYQFGRVERICKKLGLRVWSPLWRHYPGGLWNILLKSGFKVIISGVACEGLGKAWLGREMDRKAVSELKKLAEKHRFHVAGEGGEFESLVLDCPLFKKRLKILEAEKTWDPKTQSGLYLVKKAGLVNK